MSAKRPFVSLLILLIAIIVFLCVWLVFAAPFFQEKERLARSENAALKKDIAEIELMDGSTEALDEMISDIEGNIKHKYASRAVTADDAALRIEAVLRELGYYPSNITLGQKTQLQPAGALASALYSVGINFLVEDRVEAGAGVIRALENYPAADFEVTGFVYRQTVPPSDDEEGGTPYKGEWIITATLYYYE